MNKFGGSWTKQKLNVLEKYLNFYMTALKNQKFKKIYIDCFAGSGKIEFADEAVINGSATIALDIDNKFDEYYFIERNPENYHELIKLKEKYPDIKMNFYNEDCNITLPKIINSIDWRNCRGVLFIDPYATQLKFSTLRTVASSKAIDVWYLFPYSAVNRMLKKDKDISDAWKHVLNRCFGDTSWEEALYIESQQLSFFDEPEYNKASSDQIQKYIYEKMKEVFPYVSEKKLILRNAKNSPLFILLLLISNDSVKAINLVKKVENYIIKN